MTREEADYFSEFMLEWKIFKNGLLIESKTLIQKKLSSITEFMNDNNLTLRDNDYTIKGMKNGKWEILIQKI